MRNTWHKKLQRLLISNLLWGILEETLIISGTLENLLHELKIMQSEFMNIHKLHLHKDTSVMEKINQRFIDVF